MAANPIDDVQIQETAPCWSAEQHPKASSSSYWAPELRRSEPACQSLQTTQYNKLELPIGQTLTEYSMQEENGVLNKLRNSTHYTYTFFPEDESKKDMKLGVWSRSTYNWKLSCENNIEDKSILTAISLISQE